MDLAYRLVFRFIYRYPSKYCSLYNTSFRMPHFGDSKFAASLYSCPFFEADQTPYRHSVVFSCCNQPPASSALFFVGHVILVAVQFVRSVTGISIPKGGGKSEGMTVFFVIHQCSKWLESLGRVKPHSRARENYGTMVSHSGKTGRTGHPNLQRRIHAHHHGWR